MVSGRILLSMTGASIASPTWSTPAAAWPPAGLYHFTTTVGHGKETNTTVDIGYHYVAAEPTAGLVGHWKFDEGTGTTVMDASGFANHGSLVSNPTWTAGQVGSGALTFNGSSSYLSAALTSGTWPSAQSRCRSGPEERHREQ
jgi:hypothetical protein